MMIVDDGETHRTLAGVEAADERRFRLPELTIAQPTRHRHEVQVSQPVRVGGGGNRQHLHLFWKVPQQLQRRLTQVQHLGSDHDDGALGLCQQLGGLTHGLTAASPIQPFQHAQYRIVADDARLTRQPRNVGVKHRQPLPFTGRALDQPEVSNRGAVHEFRWNQATAKHLLNSQLDHGRFLFQIGSDHDHGVGLGQLGQGGRLCTQTGRVARREIHALRA